MRKNTMNAVGSMLRPGRTSLDTGLRGVVSDDTTTPIFNALTGPLNSAQLRNVRVQLHLAAVGACEVRPAVRFSTTGSCGRTRRRSCRPATCRRRAGTRQLGDEPLHVGRHHASRCPASRLRLFVRFGVQARNTSGSATESAMVRMIVEMNPVESATIAIPYQKVFTRGSASAALVVPVTGPMPTGEISELRTTFGVEAAPLILSGTVSINPGVTGVAHYSALYFEMAAEFRPVPDATYDFVTVVAGIVGSGWNVLGGEVSGRIDAHFGPTPGVALRAPSMSAAEAVDVCARLISHAEQQLTVLRTSEIVET